MGSCLIYHVFILNIVFNVYQALPVPDQLVVPRQGDYHIGSRYDPFKEAINSGRIPNNNDRKDSDDNKNGREGEMISPSVRAPSMLPWEDDPEIVYVTEKQPETTKAINVTASSVTSSATSISTSTSTLQPTTSRPTSTSTSTSDQQPRRDH